MTLDYNFILDSVSDFIKEKFVNEIVVKFQTYHESKTLENFEFDTPDLSIDIWVDIENIDDEYVEITNISFGYIDYIYRFNVPDFQDRMNWIEDELNDRLIGYRHNL